MLFFELDESPYYTADDFTRSFRKSTEKFVYLPAGLYGTTI
jgi:hypothetical protein